MHCRTVLGDEFGPSFLSNFVIANKQQSHDFNKPFPNCPKPQFQSEAKCIVIDIKMIFHSHTNKICFHKKGLGFESESFFSLGDGLLVFVLNSLWLKIASKAKQNKQTKTEKQQLVDRPFLEQGVEILFFTKIIYVESLNRKWNKIPNRHTNSSKRLSHFAVLENLTEKHFFADNRVL